MRSAAATNRRRSNVYRTLWNALPVVAVALIGGCGITGTWRTLSVEPYEVQEEFPYDRVTFDFDGTFAAATVVEGEESETVGSYQWRGTALAFTPRDRITQLYSAYLRADKKLVLHGKGPYGRSTIVLTKADYDDYKEIELEQQEDFEDFKDFEEQDFDKEEEYEEP
jgi:hypothetical protein